MFCCAQFSEDDSWYRARITENSTKDDTSQVQVIYVDFGNHEQVPVSRLRALRKEHAELPMMAVLCALDGAVPSGGVRMQLCFKSTHNLIIYFVLAQIYSSSKELLRNIFSIWTKRDFYKTLSL